jgi:hypothetical protein
MKTLFFTVVITAATFFVSRVESKEYNPPFNMETLSSQQVRDTYKRIKEDMDDKTATPSPKKSPEQIRNEQERDKIGGRDKGKSKE